MATEPAGIYTLPEWDEAPDEALRPGGLALTRRALALCGATRGMLLLDLGCGRGVSAAYAAAEHGLRAVGLDRCPMMLTRGHGRAPRLPLVRGGAEGLPFGDGAVDVVLAECTLSLVGDRAAALREIRRVLRPGGALAMSDVYLRSPERAPGVAELLAAPGRGLARPREAICAELGAAGLAVEHWENHSAALGELAGAVGPGAVALHWEAAPGVEPFAAALAVARARPGYFLLIARRTGGG